MDTTRDIIFRSFKLNDEDTEANIVGGGAAGSGISGCTVESFDLSDVDVIQWMEKRSQADGSDAGDAHLGPRRIRVAGTLYGLTRGTLFDDLMTLRAALNPVLAQREEPLDKGYRPLYFSIPTNRSADYPSGVIELKVLALPRGIAHSTGSDTQGGDDDDSLAIPWQSTFICKDPGIYGASPVSVDIDSASVPATVSGTWSNRGTYLAGFNAIFVVGAASGTIDVVVGDSSFTITVPTGSGTRTIRVKPDKTLTIEEADVETTQMGAIEFDGDTTWPLIDPGDSSYSITFTGMTAVGSGGRIWFDENYA